MQLQTDLRHPLCDRAQDMLRLGFAGAMNHRVIRVTFEFDIGKVFRQPVIERVVEEEVSQPVR